MAYNTIKKLQNNTAAIRIALDWEKDPSTRLNDEQVEVLKSYAGFGGIKAILYSPSNQEEWLAAGASKQDLRLLDDIKSLHLLLKENLDDNQYRQCFDSLKNSVLTAFYTPPIIPQTLYKVLAAQQIQPQHLYEPSSGAGIFITEAVSALPGLKQVTAVEKDILSGKILQALASTLPVPSKVHISGLEATPGKENGKADLVVSNIPFGNFTVYDPDFQNKAISGKIHNYFFAKGLDKLADGGLLAYITTDAFLNNPSNQTAREYLFHRADFIALAAMPDNLMKDTGNTEAPSHLLILQKNSSKETLSNAEQLLLQTDELRNQFGSYHFNRYLFNHQELILGDRIEEGHNQYGQANKSVWQQSDITAIASRLTTILTEGISQRMDRSAFERIGQQNLPQQEDTSPKLTFLPIPESRNETISVQLGLFEVAPAANVNRAMAYIRDTDERLIQKQTARIISQISTTEKPEHESIVLLTARSKNNAYYQYKLYANVAEIEPSNGWLNATMLHRELSKLSDQLKQFQHTYTYRGDHSFEAAFNLAQSSPQLFTGLKDYYKEGTLVIHQGKAGTIAQPDDEFQQAVFQPLLLQQKDIDFYRQYLLIRDGYLELSLSETSGNPDEQNLRSVLNQAYDDFTSRYGALNQPANSRYILNDTAFGLMILASVERKEGDQYIKADIVAQSLQPAPTHFTTDDPVAALARSLNDKGVVDLGFIEAATGLSAAEVINTLSPHIYLNPQSRDWETIDQYLSGNVVAKLAIAERQAEQHPDDPQLQRSLEAIQKVQPEKIPFELLDFNLGERWIPVAFYERFATHLFEQPASVNYFQSLDSFKVATGMNAKVSQEYAVTPKGGRTTYGYTMLEHALENTSPFYTYEVEQGDKTVRIPDNDAIQLAHQKIESIRSGFIDWLQDVPDTDKKELAELYNQTFNCFVLREYDGSHQNFPGLDKQALGITDLYVSQKNAAWRIVQNRGGLIDHEVGLGKTLTMIVAAQELKRLGIVRKPMILALKANVDQIRDTYRKAYPEARILAPGEHDFTPDKRIRLLHTIKNNNWDCVVLTHDQFGKIPQSPEIQQSIFQQELDNVERDLDTIKELGGEISRSMLKGLEIRKNNLEGKLKSLLHDIEEKKDAGITFTDLGTDHLFIDESHKFKNLTFTTRHNRVAGLGNTEGSQKALNMLFAVRTLQEKFDADLCVTFLSGTPISNSLTEMYLIFKYLRPKEMERQRIENFDGWAAVFARKTTDFEFSVTNEIIAKERFRHFIKVPELALFYNEITDYKTAKHINLDKPELDEKLVNIKQTPDQEVFTRLLMMFAKTGDGTLIGRGRLTAEEDKGRMLIATNYAKKMAADMRLINNSMYEDHPQHKVNVCARQVAEVYHETSAHLGTQIIFSDIGTPKQGVFNLYDALKEKLVRDFNIPAHEITFIHDWTTAKKPELFRKMNSGQIRILMGSTDKAGTGLNVQARVVAMHHLDIPWRPADLEQRDGRGARQGNWLAKTHYGNRVRSYVYAVEQSLDNYKFNLLKNKQTFISQMKNCSLNVRTIDEGGMDEKSGMNFSEYIAILSGDTSLLEKSKLEKKVAVLESLKKAHFKEVGRGKYRLHDLQEEEAKTTILVAKLAADEQVYKSQLQWDKEGSKANPIQLNGLNSADPELIGKYLLKVYKNWQPGEEPRIGSLYGFELYVRHHVEQERVDKQFQERHFNTFYAERPESGIKYTYSQGHPNDDNPKLAARHFLHAIDRVTDLKEKYTRELTHLHKEIPMLEQIIQKPFEKEKVLADLKTAVASLEREISLKIQEKQLKEWEQTVAAAPADQSGPVITVIPAASQPQKAVVIALNQPTAASRPLAPLIRRSKGQRL